MPIARVAEAEGEPMSDQEEPVEYWVNVYRDFVDMGGRTREDADLNHMEMWEGDCQRIACRRLRFVPGRGFKDISPKPRLTRSPRSPEAREKDRKRMLEYHRRKREAAAAASPPMDPDQSASESGLVHEFDDSATETTSARSSETRDEPQNGDGGRPPARGRSRNTADGSSRSVSAESGSGHHATAVIDHEPLP